ncbi:hypothetical protein HPP92_017141 [Vanilla planifolia]|uniref:Glycosyltransferase n=1 Tax=Vanilla planifolia TaxID=51239 RepID=A0A835UNB2_VANPL|nr:hypothetical protein HPP92_017141 [Vanilla planifolia]
MTTHFLLVPFMAQGHMIPMLDIAHVLARRGAKVTFVTTHMNAATIRPIIHRATNSGLSIVVVELNFPVPRALPLLQPQLELCLQSNKPDCVIFDFQHAWAALAARNFGISRLSFHGTAAFFLLCYRNIENEGILLSKDDTSENDPYSVPGNLPQDIVLTRAKTRLWPYTPEWREIREEIILGEESADGVVLNSFAELEPWFIERYREAVDKPLWPIGPLSLHAGLGEMRGKVVSLDTDQLMAWLDSNEQRSVVFANFGSLVRHSPLQLVEIGHGLENSGRPFIWVVKEAGEKMEVRGRGLVIRGWAPQVSILSHGAVGGFLTHCGWNSVVEAVAAGVPIATWPHFSDQFMNERLVVDFLRVGLAVEGTEVPPEFFVDGDRYQVGREGVEKAISRLMDKGEEAEARRQRAKELGEKARRAVEKGGSSFDGLTELIRRFSK